MLLSPSTEAMPEARRLAAAEPGTLALQDLLQDSEETFELVRDDRGTLILSQGEAAEPGAAVHPS